jgi:hypothetical protein
MLLALSVREGDGDTLGSGRDTERDLDVGLILGAADDALERERGD